MGIHADLRVPVRGLPGAVRGVPHPVDESDTAVPEVRLGRRSSASSRTSTPSGSRAPSPGTASGAPGTDAPGRSRCADECDGQPRLRSVVESPRRIGQTPGVFQNSEGRRFAIRRDRRRDRSVLRADRTGGRHRRDPVRRWPLRPTQLRCGQRRFPRARFPPSLVRRARIRRLHDVRASGTRSRAGPTTASSCSTPSASIGSWCTAPRWAA